MSGITKIEWADATLNALAGCTKCSPGCECCYAINEAWRMKSNPNEKIAGKFLPVVSNERGKPNWTGEITFTESALLAVLKNRKPTTYFVNSLSDLFHENVRDEWIDKHFATFALAPQHRFLVLTKRAERMRDYANDPQSRVRIAQEILAICCDEKNDERYLQLSTRAAELSSEDCSLPNHVTVWPLPNVWLGVSIENQKYADERIPHLLQTPAAVRFLSVEPMLEAIDIKEYLGCWCFCSSCGKYSRYPVEDRCSKCGEDGCMGEGLTAQAAIAHFRAEQTEFDDDYTGDFLPGIDWVIVGGESGQNARPMHPAWARSIRDQCQAAGVAFLFKQHGEWLELEDADRMFGEKAVSKMRSGDLFLDGTFFTGDEIAASLEVKCMIHVGKKKAGRLLDGQIWNQFPEEVTR